MAKVPKKVISEQIPNDGGWHWGRLVDEANERLHKLGKHGKRAKLKRVTKPGQPLAAQFCVPGLGQKNPGLSLNLNRENLIKAEGYCQAITTQLMAGTFSMDWFYSLVGKEHKASDKQEEKVLTCKEMLEEYKTHYFAERKKQKSPEHNWRVNYLHIEKVLSQYDKPISLEIIREVVEKTENNSPNRKYHLNGLANLLKYFGNEDYKKVIKQYKAKNKPVPKPKHIPSDNEILSVYNLSFKIRPSCPKKWRYRYPQWQFLYGLLAVYGIRVHEAWNIKNWDKPVMIKNGDWIAIADDTEDIDNEDDEGKYIYRQYRGKDQIIPAMLDPNNQNHYLCIGHKTKTGHRMAFPLSPGNQDWVKEFNLIQPLNLPDIPNPLKRRGEKEDGGINCSQRTAMWFISKNYGFTPHALRHAYNVRGHKKGVNQKQLADGLGHSIAMNTGTYLRNEKASSKIEGIMLEVDRLKNERSEVDILRDENEHLKVENRKALGEIEHLKEEIERLKTENMMLKTVHKTQY